jgi:photosystem II stability/assembly factor-like uncharacterized protein
MSEDPGTSRRSRRALPLIAAAVTAVLVSGLLYLRATSPAPVGTTTPPRFPVISGPYSATYDFISPAVGWAVVLDYSSFSTNFWIFKTTDGASHWQQQYVGQAEGGRTFIHFFDEQHGFAYAGISYRTVDGGVRWETLNIPGSLPFVMFASPKLGWALGFDAASHSQHLYATADGGSTWTLLPTAVPSAAVWQPISEMQSSTFRQTGEGWLGAGFLDRPIVYLTVDGGSSWRVISVPAPPGPPARPGYLTAVSLVPGGAVVILVSDESSNPLGAAFSSDRGQSWRSLKFPGTVGSSDELVFLDETHWLRLRSGQIHKTADAGKSWVPTSVTGLPTDWSYGAARAIDTGHLWWAMVSRANSTRSALAMSSDGGSHWRMVNVPQPT